MTQNPTGPQRQLLEDPTTPILLRMAASGATTREIADQLPMSQSAVSRRLRTLRALGAAQVAEHQKVWYVIMAAVGTVALVIIACAVGTLAW